jgi:hypothetical protein
MSKKQRRNENANAAGSTRTKKLEIKVGWHYRIFIYWLGSVCSGQFNKAEKTFDRGCNCIFFSERSVG